MVLYFMEIKYKDIFEFFRLGLVNGLILKDMVIKWADNELIRNAKADPEVIDLSLAGRLPYSQLIGLMNTFQGIPNDPLPIQLILAHALTIFESSPEKSESIIMGIRLLKAEAKVTKLLASELTTLEKGLSDYKQSNISFLELQNRLGIFLNTYREYQEITRQIFSHAN